MYDYPGHYVQKPDGEQYALARIDEYGTQYEATHGMTNARGLAVGHTFKLKAHPRDDQNQEYLVLAADYSLNFSEYESQPDATPGAGYQCSFSAMPTRPAVPDAAADAEAVRAGAADGHRGRARRATRSTPTTTAA